MQAPKIAIKACGYNLSITLIAKYTYFYTGFGRLVANATCNHAPMKKLTKKQIAVWLARAEELALEKRSDY